MATVELAWAAGLFDGEGHISAVKPNARPHHVKLYMALSMTEQEPVERFHKAVGHGTFKQLTRPTVTGKVVYRWQSQAADDVKAVVTLIGQMLSTPKRRQAYEAITQHDLYMNSGLRYTRTICRNGHPFPESRREWPNGKGYCVVCLQNRKDRLCVQ